MSDNLSELLGRKGVEHSMFDKLGQAAQANDGQPSEAEMARLADEFLIGKANAFGTSTFYDFLKPENKNKKVYVCNGSACLCAGTQEHVQAELQKHFPENEIGHMTCLGRCHENSAFHYQGSNYSGGAITQLKDVLQERPAEVPDAYDVSCQGTAVLTTPFSSIDEYYQPFIEALQRDAVEVLEEVKIANIRGRGGAGFPMGLKWEFCRKEENDTKFIICNADEGDPGAFSDRYLLEVQPHAVLFGMLIAGYVCGASHGILYIRAEYPESVAIVQAAIDALWENDLLGENIKGSGFNFQFKIIQAQGSYICGEETALINSIEGQRPEVRVRPPFPAQKGLFNKPTVVNNVETLASVPWVMRHGGAAYAKLGTERSKGTKLISLDSFFNKPGIVEVEMGTPLSQVINEYGGGFKEPVKALHIGGPLGGLVPISKVDDLAIDFESFAKHGFLLGHASVVCVPERFPMIDYLIHLFDFAAYESCGKCFPCRIGTRRAYELLLNARVETKPVSVQLFDDLLDTLEQGSLCAHGGGIPLPVRNAYQYFKEELAPYFDS